MKINIAPDFPLPGFWPHHESAEHVYEFDGQRYYLKYLDKHLLYRTVERNSVEHTLYITKPLHGVTLDEPGIKDGKKWSFAEFHENFFTQQVQAGHSGRLALYACPAARDCVAALFFASDGTGKFLDYRTDSYYRSHEVQQTLPFSWEGVKYGVPTHADILACEWETLLPLCEEIFLRQILPRMNDPYVKYEDTPDEPLGFTNGSREELEHITRCICHADAKLFEEMEEDSPVVVTYTAPTSRRRGGLDEEQFNSKYPQQGAVARKLCQLAFTNNAFKGKAWQRGKDDDTRSRRSKYHLRPATVVVEVAPPSAHERAESLLTLYEWLEGKVSDADRRQLLGLDAPATTKSEPA